MKQKLLNLTLILYTISIIFDLHIFYNSITTLIRVGIISLLFLIIFIKYASLKERKILLIYFLFIIIYSIFHILNCLNFDIFVSTNFNILDEILYIWKMLCNIFIIFIVYKLNIDNNKFIKYLKISLWFISGSILICNLFKIGYSTYNFERIKYNIFDWKDNLSYELVSSKGYFHLANQIVAIILIYLPILINELKENCKLKDLVLLLITLISSIIIGNRLSTAGPLIILVLSFIIYIFLCIVKKEKFNFKYFMFLLISIITFNIFLVNSPLIKRIDYYEKLNETKENIILNDNYDEASTESKTGIKQKESTINDIINEKKLNINYIKYYYPYEKDPDFWNNLFNNYDNLSDSRNVEIEIIKHVKNLNNKKSDNYLGIGYTRVINIFNIERDFIMQYYSIGILGSLLFIGTYMFLYLYCILIIIKNLKEKFNYLNIMYLIGIGFYLLAAYFSGNILNAISGIIPLSFILGILYNEVKTKKNEEEKILGFKVYDKSNEELLKSIEKDLKNDKQNIIYNINPLIVMNFYQNKKVKDEFNKEKYNIPDGFGTVLASKIKGGKLKERITGIDTFLNICNIASKNNKTIYLYGSKEGIAKETKKVLEKKYQGIKIVGLSNGYTDELIVLKDIKKVKPDILFVALGSPKQEMFIIENKKELKDIKLIMPIGGSMDVVSGYLKGAPESVKKLHLEWLYRMIQEPKRFKQIFIMFKFILLVIFKNNCYNSE